MGLDAISDMGTTFRRQQADFKARYVLREVLDRLAGLTGISQDGGAMAMADRSCHLELSLAILSDKRDALLFIAPDDPLVDKSERVLRDGYAAR